MSSTKKHTLNLILVNIFWGCIIAFLAYRMPAFVDDYQHQTSFADGSRIVSVAQIFPSVATYYMTWGGRAISMFFIQLMLMLPKMVFVVVNSLIYIAVANVIHQYALVFHNKMAKEKEAAGEAPLIASVIELSAIYLMLWFFMPDFSEVVTWITGTVTYLWTNLIILIFGLMYYKTYCDVSDKKAYTSADNQNTSNVILSTIIYIVLGFISGLSNEAGACTILFALMLFFIYMIYNKHKVQIYQILGAVSCAIGVAFLILAPGNVARTAAANAESNSIIKNYIFRIGRESFYTLMFLMIPFAIALGLTVYRHYKQTNTEADAAKRKVNLPEETLFYLLAFVSVYVMTFAGGFANRIFQLPLLLICIGFASSLAMIVRSEGTLAFRKGITAILVALSIMALFEVVAGTIYSVGRDSFYDRQTIYYHIYDTEGVLSGNGM
ncbi:MAG: hypothetical protein IJI01_01065 [Butyrivibrio sp.]|uniref:DUF6056 family protein n=1 Tax=Butyrivibrio sp. TaxID=28121 RepID=UPI0025C0490C|nr:DUF6056 family protein [Butyrivibrio sp.]MBQ6587250.1 hypothetical protein [Butyrivibrio sp.]